VIDDVLAHHMDGALAIFHDAKSGVSMDTPMIPRTHLPLWVWVDDHDGIDVGPIILYVRCPVK
jgi:hypothetical protein